MPQLDQSLRTTTRRALFKRYSPNETAVVHDASSTAVEFIAFDGGTEILRTLRLAAP